MKRLIAAFLLLAVIIAAVLFLVLRAPQGGSGSGGIGGLVSAGTAELEQWCGRQLLKLANSYLRPEFSYQKLDYEFPATVTLHEVSFVDQGLAFMTASAMKITFTETPRKGEPVVIESIKITDPAVRLIRGDGGFVGFSSLIEAEQSSESAAADGSRPKLSDAFAIRTISVVNGSFMYEPLDGPTMILDQLTFDLEGSPEDEPGWYGIDAAAGRESFFALKLLARLNIDETALVLEQTELEASLAEGVYSMLPPAVQQFAMDHQIVGDFRLAAQGELPLGGPGHRNLMIQFDLANAMAVFGHFRLPIDALELNSRLTDRRWEVAGLRLMGLGGAAEAEGYIDLTWEYPATASVQFHDVLLEEVIRSAGGDEQSPYAGKVSLTGNAAADLADLRETLAGQGHVNVVEGRLVQEPVIGGLARFLDLDRENQPCSDRGSSDLVLTGDHLKFRNMDVTSASMAARGEGELYFDSRINFRLNAGPLEKIQGALGVVGDVFGAVTDTLMKYHVTGTLSEPEFAAKPLGLGAGSTD